MEIPIITPFEFNSRTRLIYGEGTVDRIAEATTGLGGSHVLLVSDPGVAAAGHVKAVQAALTGHGVGVQVFDQVRENPTTYDVDRCVDCVDGQAIDLIIGLGGGSSMDTAKACNFIVTNGGVMADYRGFGKASRPMLPMIAIPTTAGTGSEVQSYTLIADDTTHAKMACGDSKAAPKIAILDPALTLSQPAQVTATAGIDAVAHAVESAVSTAATPLSRMFAIEAFRRAVPGFSALMNKPADLVARGEMLLAAALAGTAIENSMLGAAHSAANPLTAHFGITHGHAVGLMLPSVIRYNAHNASTRSVYAELARAGAVVSLTTTERAATEALADRAAELVRAGGLPQTLGECGVTAADVDRLAAEAAAQWTARFNPRPINADAFRTLYLDVL